MFLSLSSPSWVQTSPTIHERSRLQEQKRQPNVPKVETPVQRGPAGFPVFHVNGRAGIKQRLHIGDKKQRQSTNGNINSHFPPILKLDTPRYVAHVANICRKYCIFGVKSRAAGALTDAISSRPCLAQISNGVSPSQFRSSTPTPSPSKFKTAAMLPSRTCSQIVDIWKKLQSFDEAARLRRSFSLFPLISSEFSENAETIHCDSLSILQLDLT